MPGVIRFRNALAPDDTPTAPSSRPYTVTSSQLAIWQQMHTDWTSSPTLNWAARLWGRMRTTTGTEEDGTIAAAVYLGSGDASFATKAYTIIDDKYTVYVTNAEHSADNSREHWVEAIIAYDLLYNWMNASQRAHVRALIQDYYDTADASRSDASFLMRIGGTSRSDIADSDRVVAYYFAVTLQHFVLGSDTPDVEAEYALSTWGGVTATAADRATVRNFVRYLFETRATGGEWIESTAYNRGTLAIVYAGYEAMKAVRGTDDYPEITTFIEQNALAAIHQTTPDLVTPMAWGDTHNHAEIAFNGGFYYYAPWLFAVAGASEGSSAGPYMNSFLKTVEATYPLDSTWWIRGALHYDPYAATTAYTGLTTRGHFASGQGMLWARNGWTGATDTSVQFFMQGYANNYYDDAVDHWLNNFGHIQVYRKGAWVLSYPYSYNLSSVYGGYGVNSITFAAGASSFTEYRRYRSYKIASDYAYLAGTTAGSYSNAGQYFGAPAYVHEWTRSLLYLPSSNKVSDVVVVFDRLHAEDPASLSLDGTSYPGWADISSTDQQADVASGRRWYQTYHFNQNPTLGTGTITWTPATGQSGKIFNLLPASITRTTRAISSDTGGMNGADRFAGVEAVEKSAYPYNVEIKPTTPADWMTHLDCVCIYDSGTPTCTLIDDAEGVQGVVVSQPSVNDSVVLFNSRQGRKLDQPGRDGSDHIQYSPNNQYYLPKVSLMNYGYSVTFSISTSAATVYLFDLDPDITWTKNVDSGGATSLSVDSYGHATLSLSGSGSHTVEIAASSYPITFKAESIAFETSNTWDDQTGTTSSFSQSFTCSGSNRVLFVEVVTGSGSDIITSATYNGTSLGTALGKAALEGTNYHYLYRLIAPASGSNTLAITTSSNTTFTVNAVCYSGANQSSQPSATTGTFGNQGQAEVTSAFTRTTYNQWAIAAFRHNTNATLGTYKGGKPRSTVTSRGMTLVDSNGPILMDEAWSVGARSTVDNKPWHYVVVGINPL